MTSSFSKPIIALDTGHKIVYYVFFPPTKICKSCRPHKWTLCIIYVCTMQCRVASPTYYYVYLPTRKTNQHGTQKSRGDYFKAAIPMMPEENKAIASFSLDNFLDLNFMLHIQFYAQLFLKQFIFKNCVHFCQLNSRVLVRWPKDLMCNVKFETQKSFIFTYYVRIAVRKLV